MEEVGSHYSWKGTKALLAYMCGQIYCGDFPEYSKVIIYYFTLIVFSIIYVYA